MLIYYLIFLLLILFYLFGEIDRKYIKILLFVSGLILFIIAGFRGEGIDGDYGGIVNMYKDAQRISFYLDNMKILFINNYPMVLIISSLSKFILSIDVGFVFLFFALLGVTLKVKAIKVLSHFWLLSVLIYYCHFFMLHEMTQIRAGVATGILLLSIPYIAEKNFKKFILYISVATLFHYTALVYLPLYLLNSKKLNVLGYSIILVVPIILFLMNFSFHPVFQLLGDNALTHRYFVYIDKYQMGLHKEHNPFNILILLHILLSVFFLFNIKKLSERSPYIILFIKIYIIATAVFYVFSDLPTFAWRLYEILTAIEIILIPMIIYLFRQRLIIVGAIILYAFGLMAINLIHSHLLYAYHFRWT